MYMGDATGHRPSEWPARETKRAAVGESPTAAGPPDTSGSGSGLS